MKVQDLLSKLADNKYAAGAVAHAVTANFDKLPVKVRHLEKFAILNSLGSGVVVPPPTFDKVLIKLDNKYVLRDWLSTLYTALPGTVLDEYVKRNLKRPA